MSDKRMTMKEAIALYVQDGISIAIEGFTAGICFAAAHEIIRQRKKDLTLCRMTPDVVYDQMVAAECARKLVFSYLGNPGVGSLHCIRRAVEQEIPSALELEEYTHFGMIGRYTAGASRLPFFPLRSFTGTDLPKINPAVRFVTDPYQGERVAVVPALRPDLTIIHVQRSDSEGNAQAWGVIGAQKEAALAARKLIVVTEEIVDTEVIRSDPNRTLVPAEAVDAVVHDPMGTHPSYLQGYWDRDNAFYLEWDQLSRGHDRVTSWLDEWVHGVRDRSEYAMKLPKRQRTSLRPREALAAPVNYGAYA
jgi:glutaconate CoA-transferase subunit A